MQVVAESLVVRVLLVGVDNVEPGSGPIKPTISEENIYVT